MDHLRSAVLFACCTAFGLTLAEHLLPAERFARQIRLITAILLMTAILTPLTKLDASGFRTELSGAEAQSADLQEAAARMQEQAAAERIVSALNLALEEKSVRCRVLDVSLHIQPDGSISINEVTAEGNLLTGTVLLKEWLGAEITVTEGGAAHVPD